MKTTPQLLAEALGLPVREEGPEKCRYCGADCRAVEQREIGKWIKKTTTTHQYFKAPAGQYICAGCEYALRWKGTTVPLPKENRADTRACLYSWVIMDGARAYSKAHVAEIREWCLDPPASPFSIAIAVTGQKHILYLCPVNLSLDSVRVLLETEIIIYRPDELHERIRLTEKICAATGKPALKESPGWRLFRAVADYYPDGTDIAAEWGDVFVEPISRLAAFLTDRKELCLERHPSPTAVEKVQRGKVPGTPGKPGLLDGVRGNGSDGQEVSGTSGDLGDYSGLPLFR